MNIIKKLKITRRKVFFLFFSFIFLFPILTQAVPVILLEDYKNIGNVDNYINDIKENVNENNSSKTLASYVNILINIAFGIASITALFLIIYGGFQYVTGGFLKKSQGKETVLRAIFGIAILVLCFYFFKAINPALLITRFEALSINGTAVLPVNVAPTSDPETPQDRWCFQNDSFEENVELAIDWDGFWDCDYPTEKDCKDKLNSSSTSQDGTAGCLMRPGLDRINKAKETGEGRFCLYKRHKLGGKIRTSTVTNNKKPICFNSVAKCLEVYKENYRFKGIFCGDIVKPKMKTQEVIEEQLIGKSKYFFDKGYDRKNIESITYSLCDDKGKTCDSFDYYCQKACARRPKYKNSLKDCNEAIQKEGGVDGSCVLIYKNDNPNNIVLKYAFFEKKVDLVGNDNGEKKDNEIKQEGGKVIYGAWGAIVQD